MKTLPFRPRTLALGAILAVLVALLAHVSLRSGPLAPVAVTVTRAETRALQPALFGIGTVEARYTGRIGPTAPGRLARLEVHVGEIVAAGQVLGEMDPVDLDDRLRAQTAAHRRAEAVVREATARLEYARAQALRYDELYADRSASEETRTAKRQELAIAEASSAAAREEVDRLAAELDALRAQRANLRLVAPMAGLVTLRAADPGTTLVAGQTVLELVDPASIWVDVRFDQSGAAGLAADLPARIVLRSLGGTEIPGRVLRVEPRADPVTEELLAKIVLERQPAAPPPLGELAEVTVALPSLPAAVSVPNAALQRQGERVGVWRVVAGRPEFVAVALGRSDLDGHVQVLAGLAPGETIVLHRAKALRASSRIRIVDRLVEAAP